MKLNLKVKYFDPELERLTQIDKGDRIDLRCVEKPGITYKAGEHLLIPLGVAIALPRGYEAEVSLRSSAFTNWGLIQTNAPGIIDESYQGNEDQWMVPVYATRDGTIKFNERICQFRIQEKMPKLDILEVDYLEGEQRGGFGSTGVK